MKTPRNSDETPDWGDDDVDHIDLYEALQIAELKQSYSTDKPNFNREEQDED